MPYIIVKCEVDCLATGNSFFGDERTEESVVNYIKLLSGADLTDDLSTTSGFYEVAHPVCWLLNALENIGYKANATPIVMENENTFYWVAYKGHQTTE